MITKELFDTLPEEAKPAFMEKDGVFVSKGENVEPLKNSLANAKAERAEVKAENATLAKELAELKEKAKEEERNEARKTGDYASLEKDYKERLAAKDDLLAKMEEKTAQSAISAEKSRVLADISSLSIAPDHFSTIAAARLQFEMVDGKPVTRVLDKSGAVTAATIEDYKKEMLDDSSLKGLLHASKGSGSGASNPISGSGASSEKLKTISGAKTADIVAHLKAKGVVPVES